MKFIVDIPNWDAASIATTDGEFSPISSGCELGHNATRDMDESTFSVTLYRIDLDKETGNYVDAKGNIVQYADGTRQTVKHNLGVRSGK